MTDHQATARAIAEQAGFGHGPYCYTSGTNRTCICNIQTRVDALTEAIAAYGATVERETWEAAIAVVDAERLEEPQADTSDEGYEAAIYDCVRSLRQRAKETR